MPSSDTSSDSEGSTSTPKPFEGHTDTVRAVAYSPDGTRIASGSYDSTIRIWDSDTGMQVGKPLKGHTGTVYAVAFSPDGQKIASSSGDKSVRVWDVSTRQPVLGPLLGHTDVVLSVEYSPDGQLIASASSDRFVRLWDANSGECTITLEHPNKLSHARFSPCGKHIASACDDKLVRVWDVASRTLIHPPLAAHKSEVWVVAYSPDGRVLASGSMDCTICLWNAQTWKLRAEPLKGHALGVSGLAFTSDGQMLISASYDRSVRAWDAMTGDCLWGPIYSDGFVRCISVSPTKRVVVCSRGSTMCIRDVGTGKLILPEGPEFKRSKGQLMLTVGPVWSLAWLPDGSHFASAGADYTIKLWDAKTCKDSIAAFSHHTANITSIDISLDGSMLVSGSYDRTIYLWNIETKKLAMDPIKGHTEQVNAVKFTPDASCLISASHDRTIRTWDARTGLSLRVIEGHDGSIRALSVSADGSKLASGSDDGTVRVWDIQTGSLVAGPYKHDNLQVLSVCWSPDGACILSGSCDGNARVCGGSSGELVLKVGHGDHSVNCYTSRCVQYAPDGKTFLCAEADDLNTVRIWNTNTGKLLRSFEHDSWVSAAAFSRDGTRIASGTGDGYVRVWDPTNGRVLLGKGSEDDKEEDESDHEVEREVRRERRALGSDESFTIFSTSTRRQGRAYGSTGRPGDRRERSPHLREATQSEPRSARERRGLKRFFGLSERPENTRPRSDGFFKLRPIVLVSAGRADATHDNADALDEGSDQDEQNYTCWCIPRIKKIGPGSAAAQDHHENIQLQPISNNVQIESHQNDPRANANIV